MSTADRRLYEALHWFQTQNPGIHDERLEKFKKQTLEQGFLKVIPDSLVQEAIQAYIAELKTILEDTTFAGYDILILQDLVTTK